MEFSVISPIFTLFWRRQPREQVFCTETLFELPEPFQHLRKRLWPVLLEPCLIHVHEVVVCLRLNLVQVLAPLLEAGHLELSIRLLSTHYCLKLGKIQVAWHAKYAFTITPRLPYFTDNPFLFCISK